MGEHRLTDGRFLHFRLLGLRPALEYLFAKEQRQPVIPSQPTLESDVQELALIKISSQCAALGVDLINLLEAETAVLTVWSVNIDCKFETARIALADSDLVDLYTCGTTLLMARSCSLEDNALSDESLRQAWRSCLARLEQYASVSNVARNSLYFLKASAKQLLDSSVS